MKTAVRKSPISRLPNNNRACVTYCLQFHPVAGFVPLWRINLGSSGKGTVIRGRGYALPSACYADPDGPPCPVHSAALITAIRASGRVRGYRCILVHPDPIRVHHPPLWERPVDQLIRIYNHIRVFHGVACVLLLNNHSPPGWCVSTGIDILLIAITAVAISGPCPGAGPFF